MGQMDIPAHVPSSPSRLRSALDGLFESGGLCNSYRVTYQGLPRGNLMPWGLTRVPFVLINIEGTIDVGYLDDSGTRRDITLGCRDAMFFGRGTWMDCRNFLSNKYFRITLDTDHTLFGMQDRTPAFPYQGLPLGSMELFACPRLPNHLCTGLIGSLESFSDTSAMRPSRLRSMLSLLVMELADLLAGPAEHDTSGRAHGTWIAVRSYVDEHAFDQTLSRKGVADMFRIAPSHVSRMFSRFGECAFHEYVEKRRMMHARMLVVSSRLTIAEVAHACGYTGPNYFVRAFRQAWGMAPGQYRAAVLGGNAATITQRAGG